MDFHRGGESEWEQEVELVLDHDASLECQVRREPVVYVLARERRAQVPLQVCLRGAE